MTLKLMSAGITLAALMLIGGQHIFGVNGKPILCVPESDMDIWVLRYAEESTHLKPGSGHTPGFSFWFSAQMMKSTIPGYVIVPGFEPHRYVNALSGSVGFLGQDDRARLNSAMRARSVEEIWYARDKCPEPTVRSVSGTSLYEVKCSPLSDYGAIWNRSPDPKTTMPKPAEFVVATCQYKAIPIGPYAGKSLEDCRRVLIVDQFIIDYSFQEATSPAIPQIDIFLRDKLAEWERNCSSKI